MIGHRDLGQPFGGGDPIPDAPPHALMALHVGLWHRRTGHISEERLNQLKNAAVGIEIKKDPNIFCESCATCKLVRQKSGKETSDRDMRPFQKVGCDI